LWGLLWEAAAVLAAQGCIPVILDSVLCAAYTTDQQHNKSGVLKYQKQNLFCGLSPLGELPLVHGAIYESQILLMV
jgi:hypothetical protein